MSTTSSTAFHIGRFISVFLCQMGQQDYTDCLQFAILIFFAILVPYSPFILHRLTELFAWVPRLLPHL